MRKERMLPELEQMKRIQLFEEHEIRYSTRAPYGRGVFAKCV